MLELNVAGDEVEIPAVVGRPLKVQRLASQLREELGLTAGSARVGEDRNQGKIEGQRASARIGRQSSGD
jgi:hypothetical protein